MLSKEFGRQIKARRSALGLAQTALCEAAGVSRAVLSRLENEHASPVQTDVIDRLLQALDTRASAAFGTPTPGRAEERLRQQLRQEELRQRHLRAALDLCTNPRAAAAKIHRARQQVELWHQRRSCSPSYIERWRKCLAGEPRQVALAMTTFGEWENAMYQNTPWSFMWT